MTALAGTRVFLSSDAVGGVWSYSRDLAHALATRGAHVTLALLGPVAANLAAPAGVSVIRTGLPLDWTAADAAALAAAGVALANIARATSPDLIHLHAPALLAAGDWPAGVIVVAHSCVGTWWRAVRGGALPGDLQWRHDLTQAGLRRAARVLVPTQAFADDLRAVQGSDFSITVVRNGSDPVAAAPGPRQRAALTAGRLWDEGKGIATLDVAAASLPIPVFAAGATAGPNGERIRLRHLRPLGALEPRVLRARMRATRVFVSPSHYEPFGLAVLEAAREGMALVLADISSFRELWESAAIFADARDPSVLAAAIRMALDDDDLGVRARERAERYSLDAMVDATIAAHRGVMSVAA